MPWRCDSAPVFESTPALRFRNLGGLVPDLLDFRACRSELSAGRLCSLAVYNRVNFAAMCVAELCDPSPAYGAVSLECELGAKLSLSQTRDGRERCPQIKVARQREDREQDFPLQSPKVSLNVVE